MISNSVLLCLSLGILAQTDEEMGVHDVIQHSLAATEAAIGAVPRAKATGRYHKVVKRLVDGQLKPISDLRGSFSFAYSVERDWVKFEPSPLHRKDDAAIFISAIDSFMVSEFSERIKPHGAEGEIYPDHESFGMHRFGCLPHQVMAAWTYLDGGPGRVFDNHDVTLHRIDQAYVVEFNKEGRRVKFYVDPAQNFHVTRHERIEPDGTTTGVVTKTWKTTTDGTWYVCRYQDETYPIRNRKSYASWTFYFDSFEPNLPIPEDAFTVDALALPVGARLRDLRFGETVFLRANAPKTDMEALEKILGEMPTIDYTRPRETPTNQTLNPSGNGGHVRN